MGAEDAVFGALSDGTRRNLLARLGELGEASATDLARELPVTRQAVQKHLGTLSEAGLVAARRAGREVLYRSTPAPMSDAMAWMAEVGGQWDERLAALERQLARAGERERMSRAAVGFGLGLFVGAQPGPVSLLCIRSVLRGAFATGVAIGAGAALIDLLYAGLGLAGAASLLEIDALRLALGALGALVLAAIGARTLWAAFRVRLGGEAPAEVATPRRAFATALAATASNPLTIATWAAIFAAASTASLGGADGSAASAALLLGGRGLRHADRLHRHCRCWSRWCARRFGPRLLTAVDAVAGAGLLGFAGLLGWRTAHDA